MNEVQINGRLRYTASNGATNGCLAVDPDGMVYKLITIHDRPIRFVAVVQNNAKGQPMHCSELLNADDVVTLNPYQPR